jgi:hypothetical protein
MMKTVIKMEPWVSSNLPTGSNMIYGGDSSFNRRNQKLVWREILKMEPAI